MTSNVLRVRSLVAAAGMGITSLVFSPQAGAVGYVETKLVSDQPVPAAAIQDTNLVNPWGLVAGPTTPFWSANNGTGTSTVYSSSGPTNIVKQALTVNTVATNPTGIVYSGGAGFTLPGGGSPNFIFSAENGTITGWSGGTSAVLAATVNGAAFKGLAIGNNGVSNHLYASDFALGTVDVFDTSFTHVALAGTFTDPTLPAGYDPFGIRVIGSSVYVTYALRNNSTGDDIPGAGNGVVDRFDLNGTFQQRLVGNGAGSPLNAPWGLALAPATFGEFANDLLVGNFGDGKINAFNPTTGAFLGALTDKSAVPIAIDGLWALSFGNGASAGPVDVLYFTAGPNDEANGLLGSVSVPEPGLVTLVAGIPLVLLRRRRASR